MREKIKSSFYNLKTYCEKDNFQGWDPYDGLNSKLFQSIPGVRSNSLARLAWIQFFKRSPINFRRLALIPKDYNPKALGLFITAYCNLYKTEPKDEYLDTISLLVKKIVSLSSRGYSGNCWGYNFDWQSRLTFTPKYFPTVVGTTFVGCALLDAYEILRDKSILAHATSTADFILNDLVRIKDGKGNFAFSYSPPVKTIDKLPPAIFNASLLGSRMLSKIYNYTGEERLIREAKKSVQFCINHQKNDGSWLYGTDKTQDWIDNFHTGYNLECLAEYQKFARDKSYSRNIEKGLRFYLDNFFTKEGIPKYFHDTTYPVDIHCPAQLVVTLYKLDQFISNQEFVDKVLEWTLSNMQDKKGFFYYQRRKYYTNSIPYMRWSQAWMMYALSYYLLH